MLSSQFNSGYRHQMLKKPLVKGFFDAFVLKVYEKCTKIFKIYCKMMPNDEMNY